MPLSTTADNAAAYDAYYESMSSFGADESDRARALTETDPGFALGRAVWAFTAAFNGIEGVDVEAEVAAAHDGRADHEWERSLVGLLTTLASGSPWAAYPDVVRHSEAHPGDLVGLELSIFLQSVSTEPDRMAAIATRGRAALQAVGPNPSSFSILGFVAEEANALDEALLWTDRLFDLRPDHILGAHVTAHVNFERAEHAQGRAWLADWATRADSSSPYIGHLRWHRGLHELASGDEAAALATLREIGADPGAFTAISDLAGLGLRCEHAGLLTAADLPVGAEVAGLVDGAASAAPMMAVRGLFVSLALAARGDADGLHRFGAFATESSAPGVAELVPGLATALADFVEGSNAAAADGLLALESRFGRYGGSNAQREVLDDTLIEALIRAGRPEEAIERIDARLARRDSRFDRGRRARATALRATASS